MSIAVSAIPSPYIHSSQKRRKNVWYSIADGNWTDSTTWMSNSLALNANGIYNYPGQNIPVPVFPQVGDDVYINHTVTFNLLAGTNITVNNIYVSGTLKGSPIINTITVLGNVQCTGSVDLTSSPLTVNLYGVNNYIVNFTSGTGSTINYNRNGDQPVMNLSYRNLGLYVAGIKNLPSTMTITGNFGISGTVTCDLTTYDLTVNGTTTLSGLSGGLFKTSAGNVLFIGTLSVGGSLSRCQVDFTGGEPSVECRGGYLVGQNTSQTFYNIIGGTSNTWTFTTNNQSASILAGYCNARFYNVTIAAGKTLTILGGLMEITGEIVGASSASTLAWSVGGDGILGINTITQPMTTGIMTTSTGGVVHYMYNGNRNIYDYTYYSLYISGTGIKSAVNNVVVNQNLVLFNGTFELLTFDLTVTGVVNPNGGLLSKSGAGSVLFISSINFANGNGGGITGFDFTGGNPTVELRGGISLTQNGATPIKTGTGLWSFTTNNQSIAELGSTAFTRIFDCPIIISGPITLTLSGDHYPVFNGVVNGNNAASTLDNRVTGTGTGYVSYKNATQPMVTGVLQCNAAANTWKYNGDVSQDIKGGNYKTVEFGGTATPNNKVLQGNVVTTGYTTTGNAIIVTGIYSIT